MLWDKKARPAAPPQPQPAPSPAPVPVQTPASLTPPATPRMDTTPMPEINTPRMPISTPPSQNHSTVLGGSLALKGELSGKEDLLIEGQFEGSVDVPEHCLTVGPQGRVKADVRARQVVVHGAVEGKVTARDKIDLRKSGNVIGDLVSATVSIEEGAYFKGSIEIVRETGQERARPQASTVASKSTALSTVA